MAVLFTQHKTNPTQVQWEMPNPLSGDDGKRRVVTLAFNATSTHALPALLNSLFSNVYAQATNGAGSISTTAWSLPATSYQVTPLLL